MNTDEHMYSLTIRQCWLDSLQQQYLANIHNQMFYVSPRVLNK